MGNLTHKTSWQFLVGLKYCPNPNQTKIVKYISTKSLTVPCWNNIMYSICWLLPVSVVKHNKTKHIHKTGPYAHWAWQHFPLQSYQQILSRDPPNGPLCPFGLNQFPISKILQWYLNNGTTSYLVDTIGYLGVLDTIQFLNIISKFWTDFKISPDLEKPVQISKIISPNGRYNDHSQWR